MRSYGQYCPIAVALDALGDRWTVLVLRELALRGDLRFSDLKAGLRGIAPNLLSERLKDLRTIGLVTTAELPPPAARTVYRLTARGEEVRPVLRSLARFGLELLPEPDPTTAIRPLTAAGTLQASYDQQAAEGTDERYRLVLGDETFDLVSRPGGAGPDTPDEPAVVLTGEPAALEAVRRGEMTLAEAGRRGLVRLDGHVRAQERFARIYGLTRA